MKLLLFFISLCLSACAFGQGSYQTGLLPSINLNKNLEGDWKLNFKVESRQELKSGFFKESNETQYEYLLTDVSGIAAKKVGFNKSVALGYLLRFRDGDLIQRAIQQFIYVKSYTGFRLAHRLAADQTFAQSESTEYRLRYRLSARIPLNGQSVDPKEFYLKLNHEYLNSWESSDYDLEIRLVPHIGYHLVPWSKLELGLDYRLDSFLNDSPRHRFWTALNWYISL